MPAPVVRRSNDSDADFELIQNACLGDLAPGASCELRIQLVPNREGSLRAAFDLESSGGNARVALVGSGLPAGDLVLAPTIGSFEDFGDALVGATVEGAFSVSNPSSVSSGPVTLSVNRPEFVFVPPAPGECASGVTVLESGQSCTLRIAFTTPSRGPVEGTLTAATQAAGSTSITLTGRGKTPGGLVASRPALDFGSVALRQVARRNVSFQNSGDEPVGLTGALLTPDNAPGFAIQNSDCALGHVLEGGHSCSVEVEFRPTLADIPSTAELVASTVGELPPQRVGLTGLGVAQGALRVAPVTAGDDDFGDVRLGDEQVRTFRIDNPTAQPSGLLDLRAAAPFELVVPPVEGECVSGASALVNGESCDVRVRFAPTQRDAASGALMVTSPLAGMSGLDLRARGIAGPEFAIVDDVNFGRVLTAASAQRAVAITNVGDQPLAPPTVEVVATSDSQAAAFSHSNGCTQPLAFGQSCEVTVTFAPTQAAPHSATLVLSSEAVTPLSVLLLGVSLAPGSLVLAPSEGGSADFGDVAIGGVGMRAFTLANPGQVPSGRLTITSDNNRFEPELGDCSPELGLAPGASCAFNVSFTPLDSLAAAANLTVESPGAGRAGIAMAGRGRLAAALSATGNRDLGRANVGQAEITQPENEFAWSVNNTGDLATGSLQLVNDNAEFEVSADACTGAILAGQSTCQMTIRFRPAGVGPRTGRIVVTDPDGASSVALVLTGLGVQLAGPGESCVNADCAVGECTGGVCCDRACDRTCQVCSSAGVCADQSGGEACGDGAACFGVDNCRLPQGAACSAAGGDAQCGSGNCEVRLGGAGDGDRICCLDDCAPGLACDGAGSCQQPTLADGAACGGAQDLPCGAGLECKTCRGDAQNRCTPTSECCGGCDPGLECVDGASCECPVGSNNVRGIRCGGGLCALDRLNACCPDTPTCPANLPNCDPGDNLCKQCLTSDQCAPGPLGTRAECSNGTCSYPCNTPAFKDCNGACIAAAECCGGCAVGTCQNGVCSECNAGDRRCSNTGVPQTCAGGFFQNATACTGGQVCTGGSCGCPGTTTPCNGQCVDTQTDEANCGGCNIPCATTCSGGTCEAALPGAGDPCGAGGACAGNLQCAPSGVCCQSACDGPCEACAAGSGVCQELETSPSCPPLTCNTIVAPRCASFPPNLADGQCADGDTCVSVADYCQPIAQPVGSACLSPAGNPGKCQGIDDCDELEIQCSTSAAPAVDCGIESTCCFGLNGPLCNAGTTCLASPFGFTDMRVLCDEPSDCGVNEVCCADPLTEAAPIIGCRPAGQCTAPRSLLCGSPVASVACPQGQSCISLASAVANWSVCQ